MGFWAALSEQFPDTRHQRCWFHKLGNILDKLPKRSRAQAKKMLHDIWMAESKNDAIDAINLFSAMYKDKYPAAVDCLIKDQDELLEFYNFPAIHWQHIRTTNPIESTFSTVRHRTKRAKGAFSRTTILTMVFKLCENAQSSWLRIRGFERLAEVIDGVKFTNGLTDAEIIKLPPVQVFSPPPQENSSIPNLNSKLIRAPGRFLLRALDILSLLPRLHLRHKAQSHKLKGPAHYDFAKEAP